MATLYILKGINNNTYYIGSTKNFVRRLLEHKSGRSKYTKNILPVKVVFRQEYRLFATSRKVEAWIKRQKSKLFIEKIIEQGKILKSFD